MAYNKSTKPDNLLAVRFDRSICAPCTKILTCRAEDLIFSRQLSYEIVILAILCTAGIFFFPAVRGPYSAVHGPVTALRSIKTRLQRWLVMALAPLYVLGYRLPGYDAALRIPQHGVVAPRSSREHTSVLRC